MKVESVGYELVDDGDGGTMVPDWSLECPKCGLEWVHGSDSEETIHEDTKCPHLRFVIGPSDMEYYFNGITEERLVAAVAAAYRATNPEAEEWPQEEAYQDARFDIGFWTAATMDEVDAIFDHTTRGIACGPVKETVLYGAKLSD